MRQPSVRGPRHAWAISVVTLIALALPSTAAHAQADAHRQPRGQSPAAHNSPHRLRRARRLVARRQARRLHVEELRRRVRDRPRDADDSAPHRPLPPRRIPARPLPPQRRLLPHRRADLHRHPHHARPRSGDVDHEGRRAHAARRTRTQDQRGSRHLAQADADRLGQHARPVPRLPRRRRVRASTWPTSCTTRRERRSSRT